MSPPSAKQRINTTQDSSTKMPRWPITRGGDMEFVLEDMLAQMKNSGSASPIAFDLIANTKINESERRRALQRLIKWGLVGKIIGTDTKYLGQTLDTRSVEQYYITEYGLRIVEETPWMSKVEK